MKILLVGDVIGGAGRRILKQEIRGVMDRYEIDYTVVNVENLAGGFGVTASTCREILEMGTNVMTSGNHIWDKKEVLSYIPDEPRLLRPYNYAPECPGAGLHIGTARDGTRVAVLNLQGRVFMPPGACPFRAADRALEEIGDGADVIVVDLHAEATSEKVAMGWHLDGRVTAVVGTHTHVPTADERVLPGGTAYMTDLGMTGPFDSVIGVDRQVILQRFLDGMPARFETAKGDPRVCGAVVDADPSSGRARSIERIMIPRPDASR
jgi:metallophosphoesterase (TIGR00282 family)